MPQLAANDSAVNNTPLSLTSPTTLVLGSSVPVLLIMIALKIFFDVKAHIKQHSGGKH